MARIKYKHVELYCGNTIMVYGIAGEWWWKIATFDTLGGGSNIFSRTCYFSVQSAAKHARKYIDRKTVYRDKPEFKI
jgi:hypothetical protein